jgi:natural product precursor
MNKKLKLNVLNANSLSERELNQMKGGKSCSCGCQHANSGGSSVNANRGANYAGGLHTSYPIKAYQFDRTPEDIKWYQDTIASKQA